jgi:osmotically-inducible protein OsmY
MMRTTRRTVAIAAILFVLSPAALAAPAEPNDITASFSGAGAEVDRLQVYEIAGIVLIRGRATSKADAEAIGAYALNLGYTRVANLIQIASHDDVQIARAAERELSVHRALDGCRFRVRSDQGVVTVAGSVRHELQKDVAAQVLRSINGVRSIEMNLDKF